MKKTTTTAETLELGVRDLRVLLAGMRKVIGTRAPVGVLRHLLFRLGPQGVITASNGRVHAHYRAGSNPGAQGELLVPVEALADLARELPPGERVGFELQGSRLVVSAAGYRRRIRPAGDPVEFPLGSHRGAFRPLSDDLRAALVRALACASSDPTRQVLNGVLLEPGKEGLVVVGTDGCHLHHAGPFVAHCLPQPLILPATPVLRWKGLDAPWSLRLSGPRREPPFVSVRSGPWTITARSLEGTYPAWRQVLPRSRGTEVVLPKVLHPARRLLRLLPGDTIGIRSDETGVSLLAREDGSSQWRSHPLDGASATGPPAQVFLRRAYLRRALDFGMSGLRLARDLDPVVFTGAGDLVVMPMRAVDPPAMP